MCDEQTLAEDQAWLERHGLTRRAFAGGLGISAIGLSACAQTVEEVAIANTPAIDTMERHVMIPMSGGGEADAFYVHPGRGRHPLILMWPDIAGLRPAYEQAARELAAHGYAVLCVNHYWRSKRAPILPDGVSFRDPQGREIIGPMAERITTKTYYDDTIDFVRWADVQKAVSTARRAGTIGHCMTGKSTIFAAAALPNRFGACVSFHGGGLVTDAPTSPHKAIPLTGASYLFAIAENDDEKEPETKTVLEATCREAGRPATITVYPARHGWTTYDSSVFDAEQAAAARAAARDLFATL